MNHSRALRFGVIGAVAALGVTALGLATARPVQASGGWGFGMTYNPPVVGSCTSYNLIPMKVDAPQGAYAGYVTGRLYNDRAGTVRKPAFGPDTVYNVGTPTVGYLIFNPPEGTLDGDTLRVSLTLSSSPALTPVVGSFEFSYNCSTGEIVHTVSYTGDPINMGYGDSLVVLANGMDAQGSPDVEVWCLDPQGWASAIGIMIDKASLAALPAFPAANTTIDKNNSCLVPVGAYVLTTGEYQVTIGPDADGVVNQIIFTGLPPTNVHFLKYNANQIP